MFESDLLRQAIEASRAGRKDEARSLLLMVVETDPRNEMAWMWLIGLVDSLEDQIIACENVLMINPANERVKKYLAGLQSQKKESVIVSKTSVEAQPRQRSKLNPLEFATQLEQEGKFKEALEVYNVEAAKAKNSRDFDHIYKQIRRIERLQDEKIQYVKPRSSIVRLTCTWPLLYLGLAFIQVGMNPFTHPAFYLCLGFPLVVLGGFLLAISEVRSRHMIWQKLFREEGSGSDFARTIVAISGWLFVIIPHALLVIDSINRLRTFEIPPAPF